MHAGRAIARAVVCAAALAPGSPASAADLQPEAVRAYEAHAARVVREFPQRVKALASGRRCEGVMRATPGSGDGILTVPHGLVHHWVASAFIPGVTLQQALDVSRDYARYPDIYEPVQTARVLAHRGDSYSVLLRVKEGGAGITAVLDVRSTVEYRPSNGSVIATSVSEEIREVDNPGRAEETLRPEGRDSGYLWRAHALTAYTAVNGGVVVAMETLGLSRRFPRGLGWLIEPIARRLGRRSVETSLVEFATAVREAAKRPGTVPVCN